MKQVKAIFKYSVLAVSLFLSSFRLIDVSSKYPNSLLQALAPALDKQGIDVVQNWRSNVNINSKRAILAPLASWQEKYKPDIELQETWMHEFDRGYTGGIAAIEGNSEGNSFLERWQSTSEERRIFISFTSANKHEAYIVKKQLESRGYTVFVYLNEEGAMGQSATETGAMMRSAGQHYIIDSEQARKSGGVVFEAQKLGSAYRARLPKIIIYGRDACSRTVQIKKLYAKKNIEFIYKNIDVDQSAANFVTLNGRYLEDQLLPLVTVNGRCIKISENQTITKDVYQSINTYQDIQNMYPSKSKSSTRKANRPSAGNKSTSDKLECK